MYTFSKMGTFLLQLGVVYYVESPLFEQGGKFYYPSDPFSTGSIFPIGLDPSKHFRRFKGLGSLNKEDIYNSFYNPATRKLIRITMDGIDYANSLVEDINERKKLLYNEGIITNPYGWKDL